MHDIWFLERSAYSSLKALPDANSDQITAFDASLLAVANGEVRGMSISGGTANIAIKGVLTKEPDFFAFLFGGGNTTYSDIISAVAKADTDPDVKSITLDIDSPGGSVNGMFEAMDAIFTASKPVTAKIGGMAASAAFGLASQAGTIEATNRGAMFGSVGVVSGQWVDDSFIEITSTEAPNKRPDVNTDEGVAAVRAELDALHSLFAESIGRGRGISEKDVNKNFGRGSVLVAADAEKAGMIDSVAKTPVKDNTNASNVGGNILEKGMDLKTLKADHPDVFNEALEMGRKEEQARVNSHLEMGKECNAQDEALDFIASGASLGPIESKAYTQAAVKSAMLEGRVKDEDAVAPAADAADAVVPASESGDQFEDEVLAAFDKQLGMGDI